MILPYRSGTSPLFNWNLTWTWIAAVWLLCRALSLAADDPALSVTTETERLSLDKGWRFNLGDIPFPVITGHEASYANAKAGKAWGAAAPEYDDTGWRAVNLPHDWVVEGPFDEKANLSQGYRPRGIAWYRRSFQLPRSDKGRDLEIQFDGVATHCTVWVNGIVAARNWCGYTSFQIDLTPFARFGDDVNTIAVQVDANAMEGWWYEGGGIYRHTWLVKRNPVHVITDGIYANPTQSADGAWTLPIEATLANSGHEPAQVEVTSVLLDATGKEIARGSGQGTAGVFQNTPVRFTIPVSSPHLWSVDDPTLYQVQTTVTRGGAEVDRVTTRCGFRTERFDAQNGFFLNGKPLKIHGVCEHQGAAGVGVAVPDSLFDFRIRKLKEMGVNAIRCAHNPPAAEFLEACDRLGMMILDENRNFNPTPEYIRQLQWMVRRDRNHPSVIIWSVFNEEPMQGSEAGYEMVRRMSAAVKELDTSRPVTAAMSGGILGGINVSDAVDLVGFNYQPGNYDKYHQSHPDKPMTSSEDTSAFMTRGEWFDDKDKHICASYDEDRAPWGATHHDAWREVGQRPFIAGDFIWTGFDYRGEPTPYKWPSVSSYFGCMDLCGFPKTAFFLHQSQWIQDRPILTLLPHWNWAGKEGKPIKVIALSNADTVELSLNGKVISEQKADPYVIMAWQVPYAPGRLEAVAKKDGKEVARATVETTGPATGLKVIPDRNSAAGDGWDALPVTVEAIDSAGRVVPDAGPSVTFALSGPGKIIGLGNGNPTCHEPEKGNVHSLFNGYGQVVVQTNANGSGPLTLHATADGLTPGEATIQVTATPEPPFVPALTPIFSLSKWSMSPVATTAPDPNVVVAENDMNSWLSVQTGHLQTFTGGTFALYRVTFQPFGDVQENGGTLAFHKLRGKANVYLDGKQIGSKPNAEEGDLSLPLPRGTGNHTLNVVIEADPGQPAGLDGPVTIESSAANGK
jgi:beta-galactosidase